MMLRNWGLGRLVASCVAYWVVLLAIVLGPTARQYYEVQRRDGHGTISVSWSGSALFTCPTPSSQRYGGSSGGGGKWVDFRAGTIAAAASSAQSAWSERFSQSSG
jgi:hypothetical protein